MKELLMTNKRELKRIIKDTKLISDNTQFTVKIEKYYNYFHMKTEREVICEKPKGKGFCCFKINNKCTLNQKCIFQKKVKQ